MKFELLQIKHKNDLDNVINTSKPYCDFLFTNLHTWNKGGNESFISFVGDSFALKIKDNFGKNFIYTVAGKKDVAKTVKELIKTGVKELHYVPHETVNQLKKSNLNVEVTEDRDNFEYIYNLQQIKDLKGNKFEGKRRLYNRFLKTHKNTRVSLLALNKKEVHKEVISVYETWLKYKGLSKDDLQVEMRAFLRYLDYRHFLHKNKHTSISKSFYDFGIYKNNNLIGFQTNEVWGNTYVVSHFAKSDCKIKDTNTFMLSSLADFFYTLGYKYLNYDVDLGEENLRKAKMLWRPEFFLKKYKVKIK